MQTPNGLKCLVFDLIDHTTGNYAGQFYVPVGQLVSMTLEVVTSNIHDLTVCLKCADNLTKYECHRVKATPSLNIVYI